MIRHNSNPDFLMQICTKSQNFVSFHFAVFFFFFSNMENKWWNIHIYIVILFIIQCNELIREKIFACKKPLKLFCYKI